MVLDICHTVLLDQIFYFWIFLSLSMLVIYHFSYTRYKGMTHNTDYYHIQYCRITRLLLVNYYFMKSSLPTIFSSALRYCWNWLGVIVFFCGAFIIYKRILESFCLQAPTLFLIINFSETVFLRFFTQLLQLFLRCLRTLLQLFFFTFQA